MDQYLQAKKLVKIRTIAILTSLGLTTALVLVIMFSQTSHALIVDNVLPQTTQKLKGVMSQALTQPSLPTPLRNPLKNPEPSESQSSSPAAQTQAATPVANESASVSTQQPVLVDPLPTIDARLQAIELLPVNYLDNRSSKKPTAHFAITSSSPSRLLLLEPTDQGWQFLGVMWYGWTVITVGVAASIVFWKRKGEQLSYQFLSWRNAVYAD